VKIKLTGTYVDIYLPHGHAFLGGQRTYSFSAKITLTIAS